MKKIVFLLLVSFSGFSQNDSIPKSFQINNGIIVWEKIYDLKENQISDLKNNLNLKFNNENSGIAENLNCKCKNGSIFLASNFKLSFKIETKDNRYKILVSNIIFNDDIQLNTGGITTSKKEETFEFYTLRSKDGLFRKNSQNLTNMKCLDSYFTKIFSIEKAEKKEW